MREIEVKILDVDRVAIEKKLRSLGAKKLFDHRIDFRYFDFSDGRLRKKGTVLRLRKNGDRGELTVKSDLRQTKNAKTANEIETEVDFDSTRRILLALGYEERSKTVKRRIEYVLGRVHFEIDKLPGIPWLLEIEAPTIKALKETVALLGYKQSDARPWWWKDVLAHYKKKGAIA